MFHKKMITIEGLGGGVREGRGEGRGGDRQSISNDLKASKNVHQRLDDRSIGNFGSAFDDRLFLQCIH